MRTLGTLLRTRRDRVNFEKHKTVRGRGSWNKRSTRAVGRLRVGPLYGARPPTIIILLRQPGVRDGQRSRPPDRGIRKSRVAAGHGWADDRRWRPAVPQVLAALRAIRNEFLPRPVADRSRSGQRWEGKRTERRTRKKRRQNTHTRTHTRSYYITHINIYI